MVGLLFIFVVIIIALWEDSNRRKKSEATALEALRDANLAYIELEKSQTKEVIDERAIHVNVEQEPKPKAIKNSLQTTYIINGKPHIFNGKSFAEVEE
jgi:hypothetical protein